jgi:acyl carrier protein
MNSPAQSEAQAPPELVREVASVIIEAVNLRNWNTETLTAEVSLRTGGLGLDSVDMLEVIVAIEHRFNLKVEDAESGQRHFRTIGSIAEFVAQGRREQQTPAS